MVFTIGDLLLTARKLSNEHRHCPFAAEKEHNQDGEVCVGTYFKGYLAVSDEDPLITFHSRYTPRPQRYYDYTPPSPPPSILRQYVQAKHDGK